MNRKIEDEIILKKIALIISEYPRYTMKEIAENAGISKASLYRVYGSRDDLVNIITELSKHSIQTIIDIINNSDDDLEMHLCDIIKIHFDNMEFIYFASANQVCESNNFMDKYINSLDDFFQKGQNIGFLREDISAPTITEFFISLFCGITGAVHRNRINTDKQVDTFYKLFFSGIKTK